MFEIIDKKRNGLALTKDEIEYVVNGYTNGNIPDYQMSALLMAICLNGMNDEEISNLTISMANSGNRIDLSKFENTVDKHSTGGVGDKTTLIVAPIVACLNCKVAKMSGRALGYTGGTIDKLESIEGFKTKLSESDFFKQVEDINIGLISQTENVAPADKKIYALRDVTATVQSIPLIASSIMSKKIASGARNLVIDVKVGNGAFMKNVKDATMLGNKIVNIGKSNGINTVAILTNMEQPLGNKIGNLLEVQEAIDVLNDKGPEDLKNIAIEIATIMNAITNKIDYNVAKDQVIKVINDKSAYKKLLQLITIQGGNINSITAMPKYKYPIYSDYSGYITKMDTEKIGLISGLLGAGRQTKDEEIDYTAGIVLNKKLNDYVEEKELLAVLCSSKPVDFKELGDRYKKALTFGNKKIKFKSIIGIIGEINGRDSKKIKFKF